MAGNTGIVKRSLFTSRARRAALLRSQFPYVLVAPVALLVMAGVLYPVGYLLTVSCYDYSPYLGRAMRWVGGLNYLTVLHDPEFWHALQASGIWVVGSVLPQFLLGLAMALLLNERFRGRGLVRTVVLAPWAVSGVITGVIWLWLFDGTIGVVNDLLIRTGLAAVPVPWGLYPITTWFMVFAANTWRGAPFFAIVLLAALQSIDPELYAAAEIDGAGAWQRFRFVTVPLITNAIVLTTLLRALWTFNFIDLLLTMTQGGPVDTTKTLPLYVFDVAYQKGDFGYASALSIVLSALLLGLSVLYWQLNRLDPVS